MEQKKKNIKLKYKTNYIKKIKLNKNKKINFKNFKKRFFFSKVINKLTKKGNKYLAKKVFKKALLKIKIITKKNPFIIFFLALKNLKPYIETIKIKKAGKNQEVPVPLKKKRQLFLVLKWFFLSLSIHKKQNCFLYNILAKEILELYLYKGDSLKYKKQNIKKVFDNRALSHFRWIKK